MAWRQRIHEIDWSVYAIIGDAWLEGRDLEQVAVQLMKGGVGVLQYRNKRSAGGILFHESKILRRVTKAYSVPFIINDRIDIAQAVEADGVHLGQEDIPIAAARRLLGEDALLGGSVHDLKELKTADDADYLGVGTIFPSPTKPDTEAQGLDGLRLIRSRTDRPIVAIGGINDSNVASVIRSGVDGVAVISHLLKEENVEGQTTRFAELVKRLKNMEASD